MENVQFLVAAFFVFWAFTFFYVFSIARRQKNLEQELQVLESLLEVVDAKKHDSAIKEREVREQLEKLKSSILNIPGLATNPQATAALNNMFSSLGGIK